MSAAGLARLGLLVAAADEWAPSGSLGLAPSLTTMSGPWAVGCDLIGRRTTPLPRVILGKLLTFPSMAVSL